MTAKQVIISQDLSGYGQISLGVALPVIAGMGLTPFVAPTSYLSSHTGGLGTPVQQSLTEILPQVLAHWQKLSLKPDAVYLGYLGKEALSIWARWLPRFLPASIKLIDPVMGDDGKLYQGFDHHYVAEMRELLSQATVITPNVTEAQLLLDLPLVPPENAQTVVDLVKHLAEAFPHAAILITGVPLGDEIHVFGQDVAGKPFDLTSPRLAGHYFGTGDLFASALLVGLIQERPLRSAASRAMAAVSRAIRTTQALGGSPQLGINLGGVIAELADGAR